MNDESETRATGVAPTSEELKSHRAWRVYAKEVREQGEVPVSWTEWKKQQ